MKTKNRKSIEEKIINELDDSLDHLDANTLSKLNQARQKALDSNLKNNMRISNWLPAGAFATLFVVFVAGWLQIYTPVTPENVFEDVEIIAAGDDLEFYSEIEFVAWLIEQEHAS